VNSALLSLSRDTLLMEPEGSGPACSAKTLGLPASKKCYDTRLSASTGKAMRERESSYRILDLGTGYGGNYIEQLSSLGRPMFSIDKSLRAAGIVHREYQNTFALCGDAKNLPVPDSSFWAIFIHFPYGVLLQPGLQNIAPYKGSRPSPHHKGWYSEFARVLEPRGRLIIYGDSWLNAEGVLLSSASWFEGKESRLVGENELEEIGTDQALEVLSAKKRDLQDVSSIACKVVLENIKPSW